MGCYQERGPGHQSGSLTGQTGQRALFYHFLPAVMRLLVGSRGGWFEEKGNGVAWLVSGPATGINSRREARAVMTPAQQGIHFSPSSRVPLRRVCYHSGHYWASPKFPVSMCKLQNFLCCIKQEILTGMVKWYVTRRASEYIISYGPLYTH